MTDFVSLTTALVSWFDKPLSELPEPILRRVQQDFFPMPWDGLSAEQRESVARQWDYNHDPATEADRQFWRDFFAKKGELEKQIELWQSVASTNATELAQKEKRLKELQGKLARMQAHQEHERGDYLLEEEKMSAVTSDLADAYIPYPKALRRLKERLDATPEELAAWIFMEPKNGGLAAYRNANELIPPPKFSFDYFMGEDYLAPMMYCWFLSEDIDHFEPTERYITGQSLIERWTDYDVIRPRQYIQAKIEESRLDDLHPTYGRIHRPGSEDDSTPALEDALFSVVQVEAIEREDFGAAAVRSELRRPDDIATNQATAAYIPVSGPSDPCAVFVAMESLTSDELSITLVGDKVEEGIGANGMLEISARGETRRVPWACLDLVNRNTGSLNSQGAVLLGLALGRAIPGIEPNRKKVSRLRLACRKHLGVRDDPFERTQQSNGWQPRFKVADRRGDADERTKRDAERRRLSLDQHPHLLDGCRRHADLDQDNDKAAAWLRDHESD